MRKCSVYRVSVANCGSRLCLAVDWSVNAGWLSGRATLFVVGQNVSLRLDCQRVIHLFKKKKKTAAEEKEEED